MSSSRICYGCQDVKLHGTAKEGGLCSACMRKRIAELEKQLAAADRQERERILDEIIDINQKAFEAGGGLAERRICEKIIKAVNDGR